MTHGSLFSGIGGFDLAAQWMGWTNEFHCEINPFGRKVLHHYWPEATQYHDIKTTDFSIHRGLGILTGGFPCQPYSSAGKRLGKEDDRHLWPEMLRAIREISPRWIVGENVRGLTNWNGGMVFDEVQADLETEGYEVTPFLLPAGSVNAPHRRDRIWFIAYASNNGQGSESWGGRARSERGLVQEGNFGRSESVRSCQNNVSDADCGGDSRLWNQPGELAEAGQGRSADASDSDYDATYPERLGQQGQGRPEQPIRAAEGSDWKASWTDTDGGWPVESPFCGGNDGLSARLDGITFPNWSKESIKAYGNAIVPQVVYQIFQAIEQYELTARPGTK